MNLSRRRFLAAASQATAAVAASSILRPATAAALSSAPLDIPIVDTHQHLWDVNKVAPPWLKGAGELNRSFVSSDYAEATRGLNVVKSVYMEIDCAPSQLDAEADLILEICARKDTPTCAAVIGGLPDSDGFRAYIMRFKGNPYIKGVRRILKPAKGESRVEISQQLVAGVRLLGELGMSFDLCVPPAALDDGLRLVDQCPDTRFIVDHCGNADPKAFSRKWDAKPSHDPDAWRRSIESLSRKKNTVCKISGIVCRAPRGQWVADDLAPIINHCLDAFGSDRVMFGGDWPVCLRGATYRQWVEGLLEIIAPRSQQDQRKLMAENALRFYGLA